MRILAVEDDPDLAFLYRLLLEPGRDAVDVAGDLATARRHLTTPPLPALLLLDRHLPDGDGLEFCRTVRATYPSLPILVLSASVTRPDEAGAAGASAFLRKPFDLDELEGVVRTLLQKPSTLGA